MKFNYKKIASVLAATAMLGSTFVSAAAFAGSANDYTVVYGASTDLVAATDLAGSLSVSGMAAIGEESHLIDASGDQLQYGEDLSDVEDTLNKRDLPMLLADGTVEDEDDAESGEEYDYTQEINLGADAIEFDALDDEDYVANTDKSSKEIPVLYLDQSADEAWSLLVEFQDDLNAVDLDDSESIMIAGQEFTVDPDLELGDDLVLFLSAQTVTVSVEAEKTVTVNGETFTIKVLGANTDDSTATLEINGNMKQVETGDSVTVDGQKFYINEVFMQTVPTGTAAVEVFAGAREITLDASGAQTTVDADGEDLDGMEATVTTGGDIDAIESIEFFFTPSDIDSDTNEQDVLEIGETVVDPLFGIGMTFKDASQEMEDDKDHIALARSGDHLEISFTNTEGDEYTFKPFQGDGATIEWGDDMYDLADAGGYDTVVDENIIILEDGADVTKILQVKSIDNGDDEVTFKDLSSGDTIVVNAGDEVLDTGAFVCEAAADDDIVGDNFLLYNNACAGAGANIAVISEIVSESESTLDLDAATVGAATITLIITEDDTDLDDDDAVVGAAMTVDVTTDADDDIILNNLDTDTGNSVADKDNDVEYGLTEMGSYVVLDLENEGSNMDVWIPEEEVDYNVYISSGEMTASSNVADPVMASDLTAADKAKNLLVVGGSCINTLAAKLLTGAETPVCAADFTALTQVGAGQYLIQSYTNPYNSGKKAVLLAGYEAADTANAVNAYQLDSSATGVGPTLA